LARIEIYTTPYCGFCLAAKGLLDEKKAEFSEYNMDTQKKRASMTRRSNGRRTVPQIFVDGVHLGGYEDLIALERDGKLDALLAG